MRPVDMDKIDTWPSEVTNFLTKHCNKLRAERKQDHEYSLSPSTYRILNDAPPMPRWKEIKRLITNAMFDRELLAFHATRLIDFDRVRKDGLMKLDLKQHTQRLKEQLSDVGAVEELAEVDAAVSKMLQADRTFINREGGVWATPYRALLHDGGCEVFYNSYGGEAFQRIAANADGRLRRTLSRLGQPAVVIFRYPVSGWCVRTPDRLPQSMIESFLQHEGRWEAMDHGWDIRITRDVPATNVIDVVHRHDLAVTV